MTYLYLDLEQELQQQIRHGALPAGTKLPSIRQQCQLRELSKATVLHAYQRLEAAGLITARFRSGFYVCAQPTGRPLPTQPDVTSSPQPVDMSDLMRDIMQHSAAFDICPQAGSYHELPVGITELNRAVARSLRRQKGSEHQYYDEPSGSKQLRQQISERYNRLGCRLSAADITMTAGCQHALSLALQLCCQPGDTVAVESPGFYGVLQLIETMGLKVLEIPSSPEHGIDVDALGAALEQWSISACVVTPAFATPTGALLSDDSRRKLLRLASDYDFMLVEDDIYGDLTFDIRHPPLKQLDQEGRVILCGSYSKSLSRELRLGWIVANQSPQLMRLKMVNLLALSKFTQQGLFSFIQEGGYDKHLRKQRLLLQQQRDQLIDALDQHWRPLGDLRVSQPSGGLSLWVELDPEIDLFSCYRLAREQGVIITPGNLFTAQDRYRNCLRLSFAHLWNRERHSALSKLAELIYSTI
ncbi:PLP-dependent aminotransferase family protein [uncultured Neptuniibacter sp.]|uniref:aminotransferase-like domain-containing protein n=1 Tax=uncultured Neptuniibacter sp. TaxID=502143 RepID=UPI0026205D27|nr:PLP-dependent aminotransferase family protein [uncultured Neptuniibacter sp.]